MDSEESKPGEFPIFAKIFLHFLKKSKKNIVLTLLAIAMLSLLLFWLLSQSEEDKIRSKFDDLSRISSKTEDASTLSDAMLLDDFRQLFASTVALKTGSRGRLAGKYSSQELMQLYGRIRINAKRIILRFENLAFVSINDESATVMAKVYAEGIAKKGKMRKESFRAEVRLNKLEGNWVFEQFVYLDTLEVK